MAKKELTDPLAAYTLRQAQAWLAAHPHMTNTAAAAKLDVSLPTIAAIKKGVRPGVKVAEGLASVLGVTWEEFKRLGNEYRGEPGETHVERPERYASLAQAIAFARSSMTISDEAIDLVRRYAAAAESDPGAGVWFDELRAAQRTVAMRATVSTEPKEPPPPPADTAARDRKGIRSEAARKKRKR